MPQIAVLVSGGGINLQAIIDAIRNKELACEISCVVTDRDCYAVTRAREAGIPAFVVKRKLFKDGLSDEVGRLIPATTQLIVLAGYLSILAADFIARWDNRIINIHPSLLPKYGGIGMWGNHVHAAVLANQEAESGCTVHLVTSEVDGGQILAQARVPVFANDDISSLRFRVSQVEQKILIQVIKQYLEN